MHTSTRADHQKIRTEEYKPTLNLSPAACRTDSSKVSFARAWDKAMKKGSCQYKCMGEWVGVGRQG